MYLLRIWSWLAPIDSMAYRYKISSPKIWSLRKHKKIIASLVIILFLLICSYLFFIFYIAKEKPIEQPKTEVHTGSFNPLQTLRTPYFSFEADNSWSFIEQESSADTFVYRSSKKNIVSRDLRVYVNHLPQNQFVTYVLPLEADGDQFSFEAVSDHCRDYLKDKIQPGNNNPIEASVESVNIKCQIDSKDTKVGTGQKDGGYLTQLTSESGKSNKYFIVYRDLEFTPRLSIFTNIVSSFRAL